ncbi:DUF3137 domain-containing protein [Pedobacter rhodius]|uniref:DUF3137 domain-containing protein n=1 Tax=Pedobacter rhodius TaxID=3004098 RepID=A0ABT4KZM6_9SPHI|nr:DUF3137 domain-containing protein [Pedobacter sp. SJ11]MCZ4224176.1 DUF3137 domain-containing protein [Pedobacter sp. SJ11]
MLNLESNTALQNVLATLEVERQKIASTQKKGYIFLALGIIIIIASFSLNFPVPAAIAGLIPAIYAGIILYQIADELKAYKEAFKINVIGTALKSLDQSLVIEPYKGILDYEFESTQIFSQSPDRYNTEDLVSGHAGKTAFYFAEVHAEYKTEVQTKNGTRTEWHDIFKGILFAADFNKNFNGVTILKPKDLLGTMSAWFSKNLFSFGDNDFVTLENAEFSKTFITHATDQVEARYILTPAMMERILALNKNTKSTVSLSFINSRMYIAFPLSRNYFEAPVFKTLLNPDFLDQDITVINFMYNIIQELDLNTRIWGKN